MAQNHTLDRSQYSFHADRYASNLFASLWVDAWGEQYPVEVMPFSSCTRQLLQQLNQLLISSRIECLVDLGCGTGGVGLWLANRLSVRLIGVDRCPDATAIATARATEWGVTKPTSFVIGDFGKTGLASNATDAIISIDAFPAAQDIECAISEIRRILQPSGVFILTVRELSPVSKHWGKLGCDWDAALQKRGFDISELYERQEVSTLWKSLYTQWLAREADLRRELRPETVDALISEAQQGIAKMEDGRRWYLIKAILNA